MLCILGSYTLSSSYTVFVSSSFACWSFAYPALRCRIFSLWSFFFLWYAKSSAVFSVVFPAIHLLQRISFISYINFHIFKYFLVRTNKYFFALLPFAKTTKSKQRTKWKCLLDKSFCKEWTSAVFSLSMCLNKVGEVTFLFFTFLFFNFG